MHWQIATGETADTWQAFFGELYLKGITETTTTLVVSDGSQGLESALEYHLYGVADHLVFGELAGQAVEGDCNFPN